MDNATIQKFLDEHDYDIRKTHNGRWIDQKCTMDVVCLVSDCIVEYTSNREDKRFTVILQQLLWVLCLIFLTDSKYAL